MNRTPSADQLAQRGLKLSHLRLLAALADTGQISRDIILSTQSSFTPGYLMTGGQPYYATLFLPMFIHNEAFDRFLFGHAGAMLLILFLWLGMLLWIVYAVLGGWGYADDV